jgi:DNA modification methylase
MTSIHEVQYWPDRGYVLCGSVTQAAPWLTTMHCKPALCIADPPYGDILPEKWDRADVDEWIGVIKGLETVGAPPTYWWGGIGKPNNRPLFEFLLRLEKETKYRMRDFITWKKVRGYGRATDYLFTREECLLLTLGGEPTPLFNVTAARLEEKRGYPGYNKKYPAKSEFKRRSNVWCETELLRDKLHSAQKAPIVCKVPIAIHTRSGELVLDLYSGSGETSVQALKLGRPFVAVEKDPQTACEIAKRLESEILQEERELEAIGEKTYSDNF